jgi:hypothetical protein
MLRIRSIRFDVMSVTYIPTICVTTSVVWQTSSQRFTGTRLLYLDSSSDTEERLITSLRNVSTITRTTGCRRPEHRNIYLVTIFKLRS